MLLTVDTTRWPDPRLVGMLAGGGVETRSFSAGRVHLFRVRAAGTAATLAIQLEIDPAVLPDARPYASGTLLSRALGELFGDGGAGPDGEEEPDLLTAEVAVLPSAGGEGAFHGLFQPLGYTVRVARHALDPSHPEWGASPYHSLALSGRVDFRDLVSHLRVLAPLLDGPGPMLGADESARLLRAGRAWIETHPERLAIERAHLGRRSSDGLHLQRFEAVHGVLKDHGARRVLDLGCGTGGLIRHLLSDPWFEEIVGVEVSLEALGEATARLSPADRQRVRLLHGALTYRDDRLAGFDAAVAVEVIEHLGRGQLAAFETALWSVARPETVVLTTPNAEYNRLYLAHRSGMLRHPDHRFEWTRAQFEAWCREVARRHGYEVVFAGIGPGHPQLGSLSQMAVFRRSAGVAPAARTDALPVLAGVVGERTVATRRSGEIRIPAEVAEAGLEALSRLAVDPRWMIYLPPRVVPASAAERSPAPEHPLGAIGYYAERGTGRVLVQRRHPGARAIVVVCRDPEVAARRFGAAHREAGAVYTGTGRGLFENERFEQEVLARLRAALDGAGFWDRLETDWAALDCDVLPWALGIGKQEAGRGLTAAHHLGVAAAARAALGRTAAALEEAHGRGAGIDALLARTRARLESAESYAAVCRTYCRPLGSLLDVRIAPCRVLATESGLHLTEDPSWRLERLAEAAALSPHLLLAPDWRVVETRTASEVEEAVRWWDEDVVPSGTGVSVCPLEISARAEGSVAPVLEARSPAALRLLGGPEPPRPPAGPRSRATPEHPAAASAAREFALGLEALERFVAREPLSRVHECVAAVIALKCHGSSGMGPSVRPFTAPTQVYGHADV